MFDIPGKRVTVGWRGAWVETVELIFTLLLPSAVWRRLLPFTVSSLCVKLDAPVNAQMAMHAYTVAAIITKGKKTHFPKKIAKIYLIMYCLKVDNFRLQEGARTGVRYLLFAQTGASC